MKLSLRPLSIPIAIALPLLLAVVVVLVAGCTVGAPSTRGEETDEADEALRTSYGDLLETLDGPDLERWVALRRTLRGGLDRACAATALAAGCPKLTSVRLTCSSTRAARKLKDCAWVLAADAASVDGASGAITGETRVWTCHVPVAGSAMAMLDALEGGGTEAFRTPLPATGASFADAVAACIHDAAAVDGAPAPVAPVAPTGSFTELGAEQRRAGDGPAAQWAGIQRSLRAGFDEICGDTFCEGDYPDIAPLDLACAVDPGSGRVPTCSWSFAAAVTAVDRRGHVTAGTKTSRCSVPVDADADELVTSLSAVDALHGALPGRATSVYDALVDCL